MKEQGSGHLVNVPSVAGWKLARPLNGVCCATKSAVNAISEGLPQELIEDDVRLTTVEPGAVATELPDHITDEDARESLSGLRKLAFSTSSTTDLSPISVRRCRSGAPTAGSAASARASSGESPTACPHPTQRASDSR